MTGGDVRSTRRVPVALRIRLRYQEVDQFISKFAVNISRGGMFLSSRNPKPIGTRLQFEMRLVDNSPVIEGTGEVRWVSEYDPERPTLPSGMGIHFVSLSQESLAVIQRIIEHRRTLGGLDDDDEDEIPEPAGLRKSEQMPHAPEPMPEPAPEPPTEAATETPAEATPAANAETAPEVPAEAATEAPAAAVSDTAASAAVPALDDELLAALESDEPPPEALARALSRAHELLHATDSEGDRGAPHRDDDPEGRLAELLREDAAPVEITVDAASAELADKLGGRAVDSRRKR